MMSGSKSFGGTLVLVLGLVLIVLGVVIMALTLYINLFARIAYVKAITMSSVTDTMPVGSNSSVL